MTISTDMKDKDAKEATSSDSADIKSTKLHEVSAKDKLALFISFQALLVSLVSASIAGLSSCRDAYYKELSIEPRIAIIRNNRELVWGIRNNGVGAAEIKSVTFWDSSECFSTNKQDIWLDKQQKFLEKIALEFKETFQKMAVRLNKSVRISKEEFGRRAIYEESVLQSNTQFNFLDIEFDLNEEDLKKYSDETKSDLRRTIYDAFKETINKRSVKIHYCSLSQKTCHKVSSKTPVVLPSNAKCSP